MESNQSLTALVYPFNTPSNWRLQYTLIDALFGSPTFQHAVAFGRNNNMEDVGQIQFTNEYEVGNKL